jgi:hypothetical protein
MRLALSGRANEVQDHLLQRMSPLRLGGLHVDNRLDLGGEAAK